MQIPNGFYFRQPEIKWDSKKSVGLHPSLDVLTRAVIGARMAHPHYVQKHGWATDFASVRQEVETFQVQVCLANGWLNYIADSGGSAPVPLSQPPSPQDVKLLAAAAGKARKLWAGVKTLHDWLESNEPPVESSLSESRALICLDCPQNGKGDLTTWFTAPAAAAIRRQLQILQDRRISSKHDGELQVCEACLCPLKLKIHTPMKYIKPHLSDEVINDLKRGKNCWILAEQ